MNKYTALILTACIGTATASAHTVLLQESFDGDYSENFPTRADLDHQAPITNFRELFLDGNGVAQPWWHLRDTSKSEDAFIGSHSAYNPAGTSNDWLVSRPITIPSEGFVLTFGAQSFVMRTGDRLSDLSLFITETPFDKENPPTEPTEVYRSVSEGKSKELIEKDFTQYTVSLDKWAGKTIYICFANLNTDKDILCLDDILVQRYDKAEISAQSVRYTADDSFDVKVTLKGTDDAGLGAWTLTFDDGLGGEPQKKSGESLSKDETLEYTFTSAILPDKTSNYSVTLSSEGIHDIVAGGEVTGLSFRPDRRLLFEETTGAWCGNCPMGIYNIENMLADPEIGDKVIPVSIHINGSGADNMVNDYYSAMFGVNIAPAFRIERDSRVMTFNPNYDLVYDSSNPNTVGNLVRGRLSEIALADIGLSAKYNMKEGEAVSVTCSVDVTPAMTLEGKYAVGLIMTENNVTHPYKRQWKQENYLNGAAIEGDAGGWTKLPKEVTEMYWNDVARGIWGYQGIDDSLPATLPMDKKQNFTTTIEIPDTFKDTDTYKSPAIRTEYVTMVAFIYDRDTMRVLNAAACPMSEEAENRITTADLLKMAGTESIETADNEVPVVYYDMQGLRVENPSAGIFIRRQGSKVSKVIIKTK